MFKLTFFRAFLDFSYQYQAREAVYVFIRNIFIGASSRDFEENKYFSFRVHMTVEVVEPDPTCPDSNPI
jgi:hypothetical protein